MLGLLGGTAGLKALCVGQKKEQKRNVSLIFSPGIKNFNFVAYIDFMVVASTKIRCIEILN